MAHDQDDVGPNLVLAAEQGEIIGELGEDPDLPAALKASGATLDSAANKSPWGFSSFALAATANRSSV
jgi:hypothetical protein